MITSRRTCGPFFVLLTLLLIGCQPAPEAPAGTDTPTGGGAIGADGTGGEAPTGPHGGRLLREALTLRTLRRRVMDEGHTVDAEQMASYAPSVGRVGICWERPPSAQQNCGCGACRFFAPCS